MASKPFSISFWHINVANSRLAMVELFNELCVNNIDIVSINEVYTYKNNLTNLPKDSKAIFHNENARTAVIVLNKELNVFKIFSDETMVVLELSKNNEKLLFCSIYASPSKNICIEINKVVRILSAYSKDKYIIVGDWNAKSHLWGQRAQDMRGDKIIQLMFDWDLHLINDPNSIPNFEKGDKKSWVDLDFSRGFDDGYSFNFKVERREINPDHNLIICNLNSMQIIDENETGKEISLRRIDWWKLKTNISQIIEESKDLISESNIEFIIENVQTKVLNCVYKSMKKKITKDKKNQIWWNNDLRINRSKVQALHRKAQSENNKEERIKRFMEYKREKAKYKRRVFKTKRENFKKFVGEINKDTVFGNLYRATTGNLKKKIILSNVKKDDGSLTKDKEESIKEILKYHFKKIDYIKDFEKKELEFDFQEITIEEVDGNISKMKKNKAPC